MWHQDPHWLCPVVCAQLGKVCVLVLLVSRGPHGEHNCLPDDSAPRDPGEPQQLLFPAGAWSLGRARVSWVPGWGWQGRGQGFHCGLCCAPALFLLTHSQGNFCQGPESQSFFASGSCSSIAFTPEPLTLDYLGSTDPSFPW